MKAGAPDLAHVAKRAARECAAKFVFQFLIQDNRSMVEKLATDPAQCARQFESFMVSYQMPDEEHAGNQLSNKAHRLSLQLVQALVHHFDDLEEVIASRLKSNWKLSSLDKMDHALLLVGICEMREWKTSPPILISEMNKLAQKYGRQNSPAFVNGVLDAVARKE